jgi:hypothetical protein
MGFSNQYDLLVAPCPRYSKIKVKLYLFLLLTIFTASAFARNIPDKIVIVLGTFDYPPLMIEGAQKENGGDVANIDNKQGIGIDFIKRAFESSNEYELEVKFFPPKRAMMEFTNGATDMFLGSRLDLPAISNEIVPIEILTLKSVLFCSPENCSAANKQKSANNLGSISSIPGSPVNEQLREQGNRVFALQNIGATFKFLLAERAGYVAAIDFAGHHLLRNINRNDLIKVEQVNFNLLEIPYDVVLRKDNKHAQKIATTLRDELKKNNFTLPTRNLVQRYFAQIE